MTNTKTGHDGWDELRATVRWRVVVASLPSDRPIDEGMVSALDRQLDIEADLVQILDGAR